MVNRIDGALGGPKTDCLQNQLKGLLVWDIVDHVLTCDAAEQATLRSLTQLFEPVRVSYIISLLEHFVNAF